MKLLILKAEAFTLRTHLERQEQNFTEGKECRHCTENLSGPIGKGSHLDYPFCATGKQRSTSMEAQAGCKMVPLMQHTELSHTLGLTCTTPFQKKKKSKLCLKNSIFTPWSQCSKHLRLCTAGSSCSGGHPPGCSTCLEILEPLSRDPEL